MFVRQALFLNGAGALAGMLLAVNLSRWISAVLFGVLPLDPVTYITSAALIAAAALMASYVPARNAASVDPMETLPSE